jgi:hypothetical protein
MQFRVDVRAGAPEVQEVERAVRDADPAASIDFDTGGDQMRVSTFLSVFDVVDIVDQAGVAESRQRLITQASECCGGWEGERS